MRTLIFVMPSKTL